jgi:dihydroneopterin aldolase
MLDTTPAHHHLGTDPGRDEPGIYEIFLKDVVMLFRIGVYPSEYKAPQRVRIDLDLDVRQDRATLTDDIGNGHCHVNLDRT